MLVVDSQSGGKGPLRLLVCQDVSQLVALKLALVIQRPGLHKTGQHSRESS